MNIFNRIKSKFIEHSHGLTKLTKDSYFVLMIGDFIVIPTNYVGVEISIQSEKSFSRGTHLEIPLNLESLREQPLLREADKVMSFAYFLADKKDTNPYHIDIEYQNTAIDIIQKAVFDLANKLNAKTQQAYDNRISQTPKGSDALFTLKIFPFQSETDIMTAVEKKAFPKLDTKDLRSVRLGTIVQNVSLDRRRFFGLFDPNGRETNVTPKVIDGIMKKYRLMFGRKYQPTVRVIRTFCQHLSKFCPGFDSFVIVNWTDFTVDEEMIAEEIKNYNQFVMEILENSGIGTDSGVKSWKATKDLLERVGKNA